jgi:hypothetical protein
MLMVARESCEKSLSPVHNCIESSKAAVVMKCLLLVLRAMGLEKCLGVRTRVCGEARGDFGHGGASWVQQECNEDTRMREYEENLTTQDGCL